MQGKRDKIDEILFSVPLVENFRRQWNVDRIRYSNKNSEIFQDKRM